MNRNEELRQQIVAKLEMAIEAVKAKGGKDDLLVIDIITAKHTLELLKKMEMPVEAKWHYYTNDEGRPRWCCTNCGKIARRDPHDKTRCSSCGAHMSKEA